MKKLIICLLLSLILIGNLYAITYEEAKQYEGKYVKVISQGTIGVVGYFKQIILIPQNKYCFGLEIHTKNSTYIYISYDVMYLMLISDLEVEDFKEIYE